MPIRALFARISLLLVLAPASANSEQFNLAWDNDLFTGSDRGYTNGVRLSYLTNTAEDSGGGSARLARAGRDSLSFLPGVGDVANEPSLQFQVRGVAQFDGASAHPFELGCQREDLFIA